MREREGKRGKERDKLIEKGIKIKGERGKEREREGKRGIS